VTPGTSPLPEVVGELTLHKVTCGPLRELNLTIPAGTHLGVVAADPAMAAALLRCLGREADPDSGSITLDGVSLAEYDAEDVRTAVLVAWHEAVLFAGTVRENVSAAAASTDGVLDAAIRAAAADQVAAVLPDGLDTRITERGRSLSGGQHQRIALARALAADPPVLVLHDPTTAVDAVTEAEIAERIRTLRLGRTTILVTSSPTLLAHVDRVVVLSPGGVLAEGTHEQLAADDAAYRDLVLA
jgi:putative ABC transport system ATP-binding protein